MSNYFTKNGFSSYNLADKSNFVPLKTEVEKLYINKLVDAAIILNNFKTDVKDLDVGKSYRLEKNQLMQWAKKLLETLHLTHWIQK